MSTKVELLTPVGRLVQGNLYNGSTTDAENRPLVYKTGQNAGQPRVNYFFALAIAKGPEQHWNQTPWGLIIWNTGHTAFPQGQGNSRNFAWKIVDGDSTEPNTHGNRPCDSEGFPGHWVLKFSTALAPSLYNEDGTIRLTEVNEIQPGDYIQVYGQVSGNDSMQQPGVFLNPTMVARAGYGQRIITGADPKSVGFGGSPLPAGASTTPIASFAPPVAPAVPPVTAPVAPVVPTVTAPAPVVAPTPPPAYPAILTPPAPVVAKVLTEKAGGATYEQLISVGWTDDLLVQNGMMIR